MSVHQTKTGIWFCQYRVPDKKSPKKEYFGKGEAGKKRAEIRDADINLRRAKGMDLRDPAMVYPDRLAQLYLDDCRMRGTRESWRVEMQNLLNDKVLPDIAHIPVNNLTYADILAVAKKAWGSLQPSSQQRYIGYLKAMFRFGKLHGMTEHNPLETWKKVKEKRREFRLTVSDLVKIMKYSPPHLAWMIEVEWEIGVRPGETELFKLQWQDIDYAAGTIHVRGTKTDESSRVLPLTPEFLSRLKEKQAESQTDYILEYQGKPIQNNVRKSLKSACKKAGITYHVRPYDIRHLFATTMLTGGADLAAVSRLLGHSDISTTQKHYYHLMKGEMARATSLRPSLSEKDNPPTQPKVLRFQKK